MTITAEGVYEGDGVVKLKEPVALEVKTKVHVTLEPVVEPSTQDDDPTGWKAADELIGFIKDGPRDGGENHDRYIYRK